MPVSFVTFTKTAFGTLFLAGFAFAAAPANAGKLEKNLASCALQQAPVSAKNWAAMNLSKQDMDLLDLTNQEALSLRLLAICSSDSPVPELPKWETVHATISKALANSDSLGQAENGVVEQCITSAEFDGNLVPFKVDIVSVDGNSRKIVTSQYYAYTERWGPVPLPSDLHTVPHADAKQATSCKEILSDGSLTNA